MKKAQFWLNLFNISIGLLIFCATVYVSFNHTLRLFQSVGFTGSKAFAATIAGEALFIMGAVNATVALLFRLKVGAPPWVAFILGLSLTGWANASAHSMYGLIGVLLGLTTPVFMFVAKNVISDTIRKFSQKSDQTGTTNHEQDTDRMTNRMAYRQPDAYRMAYREQATGQMDDHDRATDRIGIHYRDSYRMDDRYHDGNRMNDRDREADLPDDLDDLNPDIYRDFYPDRDQTDSTDRGTATDREQDVYRIDDQLPATDQMTDREPDAYQMAYRDQDADQMVDSDQDTNRTDNRKPATDRSGGHDQTTDRQTYRNQPDDATDQETAEEIERAKEVALQILEETGKLPGRVKLEKAAGCSQWVARKALAELKRTG